MAPIFLSGLIFLLAVLLANRDLFRVSFTEWGDIAVNALQVQNAMHFRELLGNYSRWHFHHPGPFFFYLFAAGEGIFFHFFHIVPAPFNGEYLAEILFNVFCLFLAIHIIQVHVKHPLFPALAVLATILFIGAVNTAIPGSALVSLWPPYMAAFSFVLMVVCCASVAAGAWQHIAILAFSAMVMAHSHMAQILFVPVLCGSSVAIAIWRDLKAARLSGVLRTHRKQLVAAVSIVLLFAFPILLDAAIHHPSNIDHVREYLRSHRGEHNSVRTVLLYISSFFIFNPSPETLLAGPQASFKSLLSGAASVNTYWALFVAIAWACTTLVLARGRSANKFINFLLIQVVLITILFAYWSWRITGPMYVFNGYFYFTMQLLILWCFAALLLREISPKVSRRVALVLCCGFCPLIALTHGLQIDAPNLPAIEGTAAAIKAQNPKRVELIMPAVINMVIPGWGVASYLQRQHVPFCLSPEWEFVFGPEHVCGSTDNDTRYKVQFSEHETDCEYGCSVLYHGPGLYVTGVSNHELRITPPALIRASNPAFLSSGFNGIEASGAWTERNAKVSFPLTSDRMTARTYTVTILGIGLPGRSAMVHFNGSRLGEIDKSGRGVSAFDVDSASLAWNKRNVVSFDVPNAGPVGQDTRTLGYFVEELLIEPKMLSRDHKPLVNAVPESLANRIVTVHWHNDSGWAPNGSYPDVGRLTKGAVWGSWNGDDRSTGRLTSDLFATDPAGCVVLPVAHGPSPQGQRAVIADEDSRPIAAVPLDSENAAWHLWEIHFSPTIRQIKIIGEDQGTGWGQWLALGEPRSCGN